MMLWSLALFPLIFGGGLWLLGSMVRGASSRLFLGLAGVGVLLTGLVLAVSVALSHSATQLPWGGQLVLRLAVTPDVAVMAILVFVIALPVVAFAAFHEQEEGLARLIGLLVAFAGAMELLVTCSDLLTLAVAWELLGGISWALIAHEWTNSDHVASANYAFNATRLGGLGLWLAAGATLGQTGRLDFDALVVVARGPWGDALCAGILVAAAAKSAQGPFAPWLFRAMDGPSSVSALLHSSTMVAAGAWLLIRLSEPLSAVSWFGPAAIAVGLATAVSGGIVASVQSHAKRLLAASTSAQYGFMFAAVGAGFASAGLAHLVAHAVLKALLFLGAGIAIGAAGQVSLARMRLGKRLPAVRVASGIGALALAGLFPLGAAWTKEQIVAALGHAAPSLAVIIIVAGGLSAWYAARFQLLAYGSSRAAGERVRAESNASQERVGRGGARGDLGLGELFAIWFLAAITLLSSLAWLPGARRLVDRVLPGALPSGEPWELWLSITLVVLVLVTARIADGRGHLTTPDAPPAWFRSVRDWLGLPAVLDKGLAEPVRGLAEGVARFDDRVVDAGVRGAAFVGRALSRALTSLSEKSIDALVDSFARSSLRTAQASRELDDRGIDAAVDATARGVGLAGARTRRLQSGAVPAYYSVLAASLLVLMLALILWR